MKSFLVQFSLLVSLIAYVSCSSSRDSPVSSSRGSQVKPVRLAALNMPVVSNSIIPDGTAGRWRVRPMNPRYITIHTTQNYARGAGAAMHAKALKNGALKSRNNSLGFLTWHYSVDSRSIHQHLPDREQGQHADYEGNGNRYSIGIEICENSDGSFSVAKDNAAKLAATLMKKHGIGIEGVMGHYHWERIRYSDGKNLGHKNCPKPLMTNGKPGAKWEAFKMQILGHYRKL